MPYGVLSAHSCLGETIDSIDYMLCSLLSTGETDW